MPEESISIIIPCFDEPARLEETTSTLLSALRGGTFQQGILPRTAGPTG